MSFMSVVGGLASLASSTLDSIGASGWLGNSAAESLNKNTAKTNADISFQESRKRALLEPSWNVQGLRAAGLNPILAASSFGNGSTAFTASGQTLNTSDPSIGNPVNSALQASNLEKQNVNLDKQNDLLSSEKKQVEANTLRSLSEAQLNSAKISNTNQDTFNKARNRGLSGPYGLANQIGMDIDNRALRLWSDVKSGSAKALDFIKRIASPSSNSAKDYSDGVNKVKKVKEQFGGAFYDSRH